MELRCACQHLAANGQPSENGLHSVHPTLPAWQVGMFPRVKASGVGHSWFKEMFCEKEGGKEEGGFSCMGQARLARRCRFNFSRLCRPVQLTARHAPAPSPAHCACAGAGNDSRSLNIVMTELQPTLDM